MYAVIVEYKLMPESLDEAIRIWNNYVLPMEKEHRGFVAGFFMVDHHSGKAIGLGIWENRNAAAAFEQTGLLHQLVTEFYELLTDNPVTRYLEVEAWETGRFFENEV